MIKYRIIKSNYKALPELGKNNWQLIYIDGDNMIFSKEEKKTINITIDKPTPEWEEFIKLFRNINPKGSYDKTLIRKYHKAIKEHSHKLIMDNLTNYKLYLEVKKTIPPDMVSTYLNQNRFLDKYEVIQDLSRKFINDIFIERKLNKEQIDNALSEINAWETKQKKEITSGVVNNIINYIVSNGR